MWRKSGHHGVLIRICEIVCAAHLYINGLRLYNCGGERFHLIGCQLWVNVGLVVGVIGRFVWLIFVSIAQIKNTFKKMYTLLNICKIFSFSFCIYQLKLPSPLNNKLGPVSFSNLVSRIFAKSSMYNIQHSDRRRSLSLPIKHR